MKKLIAIFALLVACHAADTNEMTITIMLSAQDTWAALRQMNRPAIARTNWPITTVSNYFVFMCRNQIKNFTAMELQQFEWEEKAKLSSAPPVIRARVHDLIGVTNPPPSLVAPPTP